MSLTVRAAVPADLALLPGIELAKPAWGPELRRRWQAEVDAGLHDLGHRLVMHFLGPAPRVGR